MADAPPSTLETLVVRRDEAGLAKLALNSPDTRIGSE